MTGVQTCALPIFLRNRDGEALSGYRRYRNLGSSRVVAPFEAGAATGTKNGAAAYTNALVESGIGDWFWLNGDVNLISRFTAILRHSYSEALSGYRRYQDFGASGIVAPFEAGASAGAKYSTASRTNALVESGISDGKGFDVDINLIGCLTTILRDGDREALTSRRCYCNLGSGGIVAPLEAGASAGTKYCAASCTNALIQPGVCDGFRLKRDIYLIGRLATILGDGYGEALTSRRCYCNLGSGGVVAPLEAGASASAKYSTAACADTLVNSRAGNWFGFDRYINLICRLATILGNGDGEALGSPR